MATAKIPSFLTAKYLVVVDVGYNPALFVRRGPLSPDELSAYGSESDALSHRKDHAKKGDFLRDHGKELGLLGTYLVEKEEGREYELMLKPLDSEIVKTHKGLLHHIDAEVTDFIATHNFLARALQGLDRGDMPVARVTSIDDILPKGTLLGYDNLNFANYDAVIAAIATAPRTR